MTCENYTYLQGQEEASLAGCFLDTSQSVPLKLNLTAKKPCEHGSETESSQTSQSLETSKNLMEPSGEGQLMLFAEASPAKTSAQQEKGQASQESAVACGRKWQELLGKLGLDLSLLKTPRFCGPEAFQPCSKTLPRWGMMQDGECWELGTLVRPIKGTGCGSWPTPATRDYKGSYTKDALVRKDGKSRMDALNGRYGDKIQKALQSKFWPTPTKSEGSKISSQPNYGQIGLSNHPKIAGLPDRPKGTKDVAGGTVTRQKYPTPTRQDHKRRGPNSKQQGLSNVEPASKGQLNPDWVEWLMGWPIGWTDLKPLETDRFQQWQQQHSGF